MELARRAEEDSSETHVLWLSAHNGTTFDQSIRDIEQRLEIDTKRQGTRADSIRFFRTRLRDAINGKWLVVLDEIEDVQWLLNGNHGERRLDYLPLDFQDSMLVITRNSLVASKLVESEDMVLLDTISEQEAISFIKAKLADRNDDVVNRLAHVADIVNHLPLALEQALGMVPGSSVTASNLLERLLAIDEHDTLGIKRPLSVGPEETSHEDATDPWLPVAEPESTKTSSFTISYTDPSRTAQDSGYGSYESASVVKADNEEQDGASDVRSISTVSSFIDLGLEGRLKGINIFASDLVQSLSPDTPGVVEGRELVVAVVQLALRAYSYSLEQRTRPDRTSDERKAAHFIRQQSHDIAERVIDQIARTRSVDSGESPPDAGMFAEPASVLGWLGSTFAPPVMAETSDEVAAGEALAGEDKAQSDTIQKMRDFLSDNPTFEWLKRRVEAAMSTSGGKGLSTVSKKLLGVLTQGFSVANDQGFRYSVEWDPHDFMQYNYAGYVDIANVISINSDGHACEACTVGEYIARAWPITGPRFLEVLSNWWRHIDNGRKEEPLQHFLLDGEVTLTQKSSIVRVNIAGPVLLIMEIGEQLAWLASVCRKGMFPDHLTLVRPDISHTKAGDMHKGTVTVNISFTFEKLENDTRATSNLCWLKLFRNCCIADGVSVNTRQEGEEGLELPFSMMATLGGFDRVANYAGQLVLKGFETLFVPVRKSGESLVWHLITKPNGRRISYNAMYTLSDQADPTVCMQDLYDSRHFLGWVSNASQHTGTKDGVYVMEKEVFLEPPGQGLVLSGVGISMSKIVGIAATITPGRHDRGIRTSNKEMFYVEVVEKMSKMHVLLYDHGDGRGWLVDGASAVLHLLRFHVTHYQPICDGERFKLEQFQYAESAAGVKSARDVLLSREMRKVVLVEEPLPDSEKQVTETIDGITTVKTVVERLMKRKTVEDRVRDLYEILELMYDSWKRRKTAPGIALESLNMRLEGWKFQDVVELENDMNPVVAKLDGSADDWLRMVRHVNTVVLIGNGFGDMMKPMGDFCTNWESVPQKDFCLAVPVSRLKRIAQKYGDPGMVPIKLTPDVFWPINQHPFICACASASETTCYRGQQLRSNGLRSGSLQLDILTAAEHANGAVIFEGHRSVRQVVQTAINQSPEHRKRPVKPAWLRNVRDRFRSKKENGSNSSAAA
ncbi:hypothetical protein MBLNU13_g10914t3 [Cladosporium sp. NU13]